MRPRVSAMKQEKHLNEKPLYCNQQVAPAHN